MAHWREKTFVLALFTSFMLFCPPLWAATFNVTPTSDNDCTTDSDCDLQSALNAASSNDEGDAINLAAGTYDASGGAFAWNSDKNFPVTLNGSDGTIIDGGSADRGMLINTSNMVLDTNAHITIKNIIFQNGNPPSDGGGALLIVTNLSNITIENCQFIGNLAAGAGGGLYASSATGKIRIADSLFSQNTSDYQAGGAYAGSFSGAILLSNNIFTKNSANIYYGGGASLITEVGPVTVVNNTLTANSASYGGGLYVELDDNRAIANLYNNIAWNNEASSQGNDIYMYDYLYDDFTGADVGAEVNLHHNDYSDFYSECENDVGCTPNISATDNIDADPLFLNVRDPDPSNWDLHLASGSPCIDVGDNLASSLPVTDFEADNRIIDGNQDGKDMADIGADEYIPSTFADVILLAPNGREVIPSGSTYAVKWGAPPEAKNFTLMYSMNNGKTWSKIADALTDVTHDWTVPEFPKIKGNKKKCLVKVIGYAGPEMKVGIDISNAYFSIETVTVTSPNGGESWLSGTTAMIAWRAAEHAVKFNVTYSMDNKQTWVPIKNGVTGTSLSWTLPKLSTPKKKCFVRVVALDASKVNIGSDTSDAPFTIEAVRLISPNGGEIVPANESYDIRWTVNEVKKPVDHVELLYSLDGGMTWKSINTERVDGNPGTYPWLVPPVEETMNKCKVKLVLKDNKGATLASDVSDNPFTISTSPQVLIDCDLGEAMALKRL